MCVHLCVCVPQLSQMSSEEYRSLIKCLETHYAEFRANSHGSQLIEEEDMMAIESQYNGAQNHYEQLVVQLPSYTQYASTDYGTQPKILELNHLIVIVDCKTKRQQYIQFTFVVKIYIFISKHYISKQIFYQLIQYIAYSPPSCSATKHRTTEG